MMLVSAETLQTIKTAHDARILNDKALRELVSASSEIIPKYQVRIEVTGASKPVGFDEEITDQSFAFDLNCDTLAKWAGLVQRSYGKDAVIDLNFLPSREQLECKIGTSEIRFNRKGVYLGEPFKLELDNDRLVLNEKIDREEMKQKRAALAHTRKIERFTKLVAKCERDLSSTVEAIERQEKSITEAEGVIASQTREHALAELKLIHLHRRKLNVLRRIIDPTDEDHNFKVSGLPSNYTELLEHDAPDSLLTWPQFLALSDVIITREGYYCKCTDPECNFASHAPYTAIDYGRDYYAAGFASYSEKRRKLHGIRYNGWRLHAGQIKKVDDFKQGIRNLVKTVEIIYRAALEREHGKEFADRVLYSYQRRGSYGEARRILRSVPRDLASLRIEREIEIEALETAKAQLAELTS